MTSTVISTVEPTTRTTIATLDPAGWLGTLSPNTARAYHSDVTLFGTWLAEHGIDAYTDVTPAVVTAWLAGLGQSPATQVRKLSSVCSLYRYLRAEGLTTVDPRPFSAPKVHRDRANVGMDARTAARVWVASEGQPRLRALVAVMMFSGLRVAEAVGLQVSDVQDQSGARVLRVMGKGSKPRTAVLPAVSVVALTEWLAVRGEQDGPLFSTSTGAAMDVRAAHREIVRLGRKAGIEGLHPHSLRHAFGVAAADAGQSILQIATAMGHASPTTSMIYVEGRDVIASSPVHAVAAAILGASS